MGGALANRGRLLLSTVEVVHRGTATDNSDLECAKEPLLEEERGLDGVPNGDDTPT